MPCHAILENKAIKRRITILLRAAEGSPRQLARTQMVRTELAKTRPKAGEADITRQVEKITST
jgi:hypothetical protein